MLSSPDRDVVSRSHECEKSRRGSLIDSREKENLPTLKPQFLRVETPLVREQNPKSDRLRFRERLTYTCVKTED